MKKPINTGHKTRVSWWHQVYPPLLLIVLLIGIWELTARFMLTEDYILPPPSDVLSALVNSWDLLMKHTTVTLYETVFGLVIAVIAGIIVAVAIDFSSVLRRAIYPLLVISQTIPYFALAPIFLLLFGLGPLPRILIVALVCFFPITVSLAGGLQSVEREYITFMRAMNATKWQIFRFVKWPAALPSLFTGLRMAATYSVMSAVIGELFGGSRGLGILLSLSTQSYLYGRVFATIVVIIGLSLLIYMIVECLARFVMHWQYKS
ncbi:ABC transporter permease [Tuberibacillus sp. Marseille-P3662]|uniref:ABC transporter permease n=1 Tax=Tuberibacillus sp. Marseille-P3662 TaxID=1965358 RepID=UPI000A1CBA52|nr:ABC transporter permease [Tuberibacillus sp. Marseille-P3662]